MKTCVLVLAGALLAGCATAPPATQSTGQTFTGEVWVWDEQRSTVTLLRGGQPVRVKVTPDQLRGLRHHEITTVRGEVDAEMPIQHDIVAMAMAQLRGPVDDTEVAGTVASIDPGGKVRVDTSDGPVEVWVAKDGTPFKVGEPVRIKIRVQSLELVPLRPGEAPPAMMPPAKVDGAAPGDYAAVRGRVLSAQPGRLTVDSPRGPVIVALPQADRYPVGGAVEVQTSVHPVQ